jgi:hypothetical protein
VIGGGICEIGDGIGVIGGEICEIGGGIYGNLYAIACVIYENVF